VSFRIRAAVDDDLQHLYEMAKLTGGGFTNLPPDRRALTAKLERSHAAFARTDGPVQDELFVLVLENVETQEVRGTCQIFTQVGQSYPFYSYRIGQLTQHSRELNRTFRADMLTLATDLEGASEVGGLFLHPGERAGGLGLLLARSRYLFIKMHRARFADRILAELRGVIDEAGRRPVQRDQRPPVHRRPDAEAPDLHRDAVGVRPRRDRPAAPFWPRGDADAGE
jgi:arginine N-succinyltransferase